MSTSPIPGMGLLKRIEDFDSFSAVRGVPAESISEQLIEVVRKLDEREELEPYIRLILHDPNETPHGPAEIADIFTHKLSIQKLTGMAAFILKGKSFETVKPRDVAHQIYRLEKITGLAIAVFAASGTVLDSAKEQFVSTALRLACNYSIFDAIDLARLFVAYGFLCPRDARKIISGRCACGYSPSNRLLNIFQRDALDALGHAHKNRESAGMIVLPPGSGKTRIAAEDALRAGAQHVLYVAHAKEILDVAQSEFEAVFGKQDVKRHNSWEGLSTPKHVNITTIQLLSSSRGRGGQRNNTVERRTDAPDSAGPDSRGASQRASATYRLCGCGGAAGGAGEVAGMIGLAAGTRIWLVAGVTDMRRGFVGLSGMVQTALAENPFSGQVFVFRGKRGDLIKVLWWDGDGLCLFAKRLERGRFVWPQAANGAVSLTQAQLSMLLEWIDWRRPTRTYAPQMAV